MGSLQAPPVKADVWSVREGRDGRIDKVPRAVLPILALLRHAHAEIGDLLHHLGQFLRRARLGPDQLPGARLQSRRVAHKHDVAAVLSDSLEDESRDVIHALVEFEVGLVWLEVVECHLGQVGGVHLEPVLHEVVGVHEGGETPPAPRQPLKQAVLHADLDAGLRESLQDGVGRLDAAERRGGEDVGDADALLPHALSREPGLEQAHLGDGGVLEEVVWPSLPLGDLLRHVEVAAVVVAVGVEGQLDPLFPECHVHSLRVSEDEETSWAWEGVNGS